MKLLIILCALMTFSCGSSNESDRSVITDDDIPQCSRNSRPTFDNHWVYFKGNWKCKCIRDWIYPWKSQTECKCTKVKASDRRIVGSKWTFWKNRWHCQCEQIAKRTEKCVCSRRYRGNLETMRYENR